MILRTVSASPFAFKPTGIAPSGFRAPLLTSPALRRQRWTQRVQASSIGNSDESTAPDPSPSSSGNGGGLRAVAVPVGFRSAGAVFILAGFLKILILCFPYSPMAVSMYLQGRADLGVVAALKAIPFALGIAALAKTLVDRQLHKRKWFHRAVLVLGLGALFFSRWALYRPRRSPLDPMMAEHRRVMVARMQEARGREGREAASREQRHRALQQPSEEVRKQLQGEDQSRFSSKK